MNLRTLSQHNTGHFFLLFQRYLSCIIYQGTWHTQRISNQSHLKFPKSQEVHKGLLIVVSSNKVIRTVTLASSADGVKPHSEKPKTVSCEQNTWEQAQVTFTYAVGNTIYGMYENKDLISQRPFVCNPSMIPDTISLVSIFLKIVVQYFKKSRWPWRSCNGVELTCCGYDFWSGLEPWPALE